MFYPYEITKTHINQVYLIFRGRLLNLDYAPGIESLEVKMFREADIPWDKLAFSVVARTLRHFFEDRRAGEISFHLGDIKSSAASRDG
ncbi:MAG: NUDIX hydrolase [Acidiferrobacterales bacterium]